MTTTITYESENKSNATKLTFDDIGSWWKHDNSIYILALVTSQDVAFINITSGTRWNDPCKINQIYDTRLTRLYPGTITIKINE